MISDWKFKEMDLQGVYAICSFRAKDERGGLIKLFSQDLFQTGGMDFGIQETLWIESKKMSCGVSIFKEKNRLQNCCLVFWGGFMLSYWILDVIAMLSGNGYLMN